MAQFARNSNNYTGARSKTTFSTQQTNKQTKKGKKKNNESNEINAWGKGQSQNAFQTSPEKKRESWTLWDNIEHEFPSCDNTTQLSNPREQKQRRFEQPNVWVQRQKKFEENKALEPRDENEEEKMIRLALELSKRETQTDNMRKRLEEEYLLQEQMLKNNPDYFKEFHCEESSDAFPVENYPYTESEEWDDGKYAMALKSNSSNNSSSNKKNYSIWGSTDIIKQNQKTVTYKEIDNWEGYNRKTNVSPDKITSASGDGWDNPEYTTQESNSFNKMAVPSECSNYDNWGDCDNSNQSSSNCTYDTWDDYEQPKMQHKTISRTSSKYNTSDNWDDTKSSTYKDYDVNKHDMTDKYSKSFKQKECVKSIDKETVQLSTVNETVGAKSKVRKVVDMFGGWGSGAVAEDGLKTESLTVAENLGNNTGKSLNKLKSSEPDHLDKLVASMQETSLRNKDDTLLKNDSILDNESFHFSKTESSVKANIQSNTDFFKDENNHEFKKNEKIPNLGVSDIDIVCQTIKDEAIVSDQKKLLENTIRNTEGTPTSQSHLPNKNSLVDPVISSTHNTLISQTPSFNTDIHVNNKDELNNLHGSKADTISNEHSKQFPTFLSNENSNCVPGFDKCLGLPNQVPTFQSDEHINSPKESTAFHSNENVQPPVCNAPFQPLNLNINSTQNITPLSPPFLPPELINMLSFPTNQMGGESTNPNLMGGVNPLLIQYMQMFSNPFLAAQWEMYYRTMGMPVGPMFFPQVPMMHGLRNPGFSAPINTALFENNARSDVSGQTLQNSPINFTNEMLSSQEQNNISNSISTTSKLPETPIKLDEETESLLRSFLSPKEDHCNDEVFIEPPVVQPDNTRQPNYDLNSVEKIISCDNQFNDSKNYVNNFSENVTALNNIQTTTTESSECIGWGDLNFEGSQAIQDKWDENVDGWGDENSTTKSMGNPSCYNSAKSANRQPSRQPNFRHYRK